MSATEASERRNTADVTKPIKRRGLIAAAWAAVLGVALKHTTEPVQAAASLQFGDLASSVSVTNDALGPTVVISQTGYPTTSAVLTGQAFAGSALAGIQGVAGTRFAPSMRCGVHGAQSGGPGGAQSAAVLGDDWSPTGVGVLGRNGSTGLGAGVGVQGECGAGIGVRGLIPPASSSSAIAVYGLNNSSYAGPGPGAGGFGVYGLSAKGHGLVGATAAAGGAAVVGATNGVAGAYAGAFYGPVAVSGDFTVFGAKSAAVPHPDGSHRLLYCVESPESWFEDFGKGTLECGRAEVTIDPDFAAVADLSDYHVFLTGYGMEYPLYVMEQTAAGFTVQADAAAARAKGKKDAEVTGQFSWRVVAKRKDIEAKRLAPVTFPPEPTLPDFPTAAAG